MHLNAFFGGVVRFCPTLKGGPWHKKSLRTPAVDGKGKGTYVVGSRRLLLPDALQPKAYCTNPGL